MIFITHIFYGILMAYFGLISPGMLNMTALKTRINVGKTESVKFAVGASVVVFLQSFIALYFAEFFVANPAVIEKLKVAGIVVFFILSVFFFMQAQKKINPKDSGKKGSYFYRGMFMSSVNMLAIPFYLGMSIYLASSNKIIIEQPYILMFTLGAALGSFLLFYTYISFAKIIIEKVSFIAKNINYILSLLFVLLGVLTIIKL